MTLNKDFKVVILSNDENKTNSLKSVLSKYYSMNISFECHCAAEAIEYLNHHRPMIFFLDEEFAEVLHDVRKPPFTVGICDTVHSKRVKQYLKMGFFDFFHTPFTERELNTIMGKILNIYVAYNKMDHRIVRRVEEENVQYIVNESNVKSMFIAGSRKEEAVRIIFDHVLFMKKMGDQISVHFEDGSSRSFRGNLKMFHKKFPNSKFKKVNKSVVVNMDKVVGMNKNRIKINEETHFEVSRSFKKPIKEIINQ